MPIYKVKLEKLIYCYTAKLFKNNQQFNNITIKQSNSGFTLIELMVVIALIAILALLGVSLYTNIQRSARDAKRQTDIDSIAKSIETSRDVTINPTQYRYTPTIFSSDYPNRLPTDPLGTMNYCIGVTNTPAALQDLPSGVVNNWTSGCPSAFPGAQGSPLSISSPGGLSGSFPNGTRSWMVCAKLEGNGMAYCRKNVFQ
jgi:prepilin-type N-terminal cleavage/methylation domain-containing protein